ncbi:MAG TPA: glycosyltransferase family 1 protein, partial [Thermomicrobiales bacterium]|nr:glycosyltransferase family 1 protein [Thermomicrobiales bacterium]
MRIALDATPAAVQHAGVGRYARELLAALVTLPGNDEYLLATSASDSDNQRLLAQLAPGRRRELRRLPLNPRWSTLAWHRLRVPVPVESLIGQFDVFHGTDFVVPPSRRPRVVTIHDLSFLLTPQFGEPDLVSYLTSAVPRAIDAATVVVTVSASVAAEVAAAFPAARGKLVAIPNGVRLPHSAHARRATDRPELLTVGTVEPRKNLNTLIQAMTIIRTTQPAARLTIAGRIGWRADEIVAQIRAAEASGIVRFVESPDEDSLEALYAEATVAISPSFYEGFGLPVLEAMARGVPVVTSDIPSLRETAGNAGCYADPDSAESLAATILYLLDDATLRATLSSAGIARAQRFSWQETARRTRRAYELALGGR